MESDLRERFRETEALTPFKGDEKIVNDDGKSRDENKKLKPGEQR